MRLKSDQLSQEKIAQSPAAGQVCKALSFCQPPHAPAADGDTGCLHHAAVGACCLQATAHRAVLALVQTASQREGAQNLGRIDHDANCRADFGNLLALQQQDGVCRSSQTWHTSDCMNISTCCNTSTSDQTQHKEHGPAMLHTGAEQHTRLPASPACRALTGTGIASDL